MAEKGRAVAVFAVVLALTGCGSTTESIRKRADSSYAAQSWSKAELEYRKLATKTPQDAYVFSRLGEVCFRQGKFDKAYAALRSAVSFGDQHDAARLLSDMLLTSYSADSSRPAPVRQELESLAVRLSRHASTEFDAKRIRGYLATDAGRFDEARQNFEEALRINADHAETTAMLIKVLVRVGDTGAAERTAKQYLARRFEDGTVSRTLLELYRREKRTQDAESLLTSLLSRSPSSQSLHLQLAEFHWQSGRTDEAGTVLARMAASTTIRDGKLAAGSFYERHGRTTEALKFYGEGAGSAQQDSAIACRKRQVALFIGLMRFEDARRALDSVPAQYQKETDLQRARAVILERSGQSADARSVLQAIAADSPNDATLRYELGTLLLRSGQIEEAESEFRASLRLGADVRLSGIGLVSAGIARLDYAGALRAANVVVEQYPDDRMALLSKVSALRGLGRTTEARSIVATLRRTSGKETALDVESAWLLIDDGKVAEAESILRRLFVPGTDQVRIVAGLAEALVRQGKYSEAISILRADLQQRPGRAVIMYALAETLDRAGDTAAAVDAFGSLISSHPRLAILYQKLATLHVARRQYSEALSVLERGIAKAPENRQLLTIAAEAAHMAQNVPAAERYYREWMRFDASDPVPCNNLAFLLAERRDRMPEALALAEKAVTRGPSEARFRDTLGYVHLQRGAVPESLGIFGPLVAAHPANPTMRYHYGLALRASGDAVRSRQEWRRALQSNPDPELRQRLMTLVAN